MSKMFWLIAISSFIEITKQKLGKLFFTAMSDENSELDSQVTAEATSEPSEPIKDYRRHYELVCVITTLANHIFEILLPRHRHKNTFVLVSTMSKASK